MIGIFGEGSDFLPSQLATNRSILQKFILVKETMVDDQNVHFSKISLVDIANVVSSDLLKQWETVSPLLCPPVIIGRESIVNKVKRLWEKADNVSRNRTSKEVREIFLS